MSLDEETKRIVLEVMGPNVLKQLTTVVPDFFDKDYVLTRLVEKPREEQPPGYPYVKLMEPKVVASTHPQYPIDTIIRVDEVLTDLIRDGYNVTVSPDSVSKGTYYSDEILEEAPMHNIAIAEVAKDQQGFGKPDAFYTHGAKLRDFIPIGWGELSKSDFFEATGYAIHFAFIPAGEKERGKAAILDNWEVDWG